MVVKKGDEIRVEYEGSLESGEVFDASSRHGEALKFKAGEGIVVKGFDTAVIGMEVGEEKTVTLKPEDAYGEPNEMMVQKVPKDKFPKEGKVGMMVGVPLPNGQRIPARIVKIDDAEVTLDMNHLLAGKTLIFKIKILEIL
ncbi:MAG: peptidylprolyl isomerase [archaeon]